MCTSSRRIRNALGNWCTLGARVSAACWLCACPHVGCAVHWAIGARWDVCVTAACWACVDDEVGDGVGVSVGDVVERASRPNLHLLQSGKNKMRPCRTSGSHHGGRIDRASAPPSQHPFDIPIGLKLCSVFLPCICVGLASTVATAPVSAMTSALVSAPASAMRSATVWVLHGHAAARS